MTRPYQRFPATVDTNWLLHRCAEVGISHAHIAAVFNTSVSAVDKRLGVIRRAELLREEIPGQLANDEWAGADGRATG